MKLFTQTRFYQLLSPFLDKLIPVHPARTFWTKILLAYLCSRSLEGIIDLIEPVLGSPVDNTWQYYTYLGLETLRYGSWFWGIWYSLVQTINFTFLPHPKSMWSAVNVAYLITMILLISSIEVVTRTVEPAYTHDVIASLCVAFLVSVVLPTCFGARQPTDTVNL